MNCMFTIQAFYRITASPECNLTEDRDCTLVTHDSHASHLVGSQKQVGFFSGEGKKGGKEEWRENSKSKEEMEGCLCLFICLIFGTVNENLYTQLSRGKP